MIIVFLLLTASLILGIAYGIYKVVTSWQALKEACKGAPYKRFT